MGDGPAHVFPNNSRHPNQTIKICKYMKGGAKQLLNLA